MPIQSVLMSLIARVRQIADRHQQREHADRHVDVEHRAPGIGLGEIAAERGPHHRRHHDAETENGQRLAGAVAREDIEQDGLAQGHERRAEHALRQAEQHHALEVPRQAAQGRGGDEADNGGEQKPPSPEPFGEIAGERHHHGGGDDIRGQHPGDLVGGRAERAQHMRDRHVDDGDVEHFQHRGQHHGDDERDRRPFGTAARGGGPGAAARREVCLPCGPCRAAALRAGSFSAFCRRGGVDA